MTGEQLSAVLQWQYPSIQKAFAVIDGALVFSIWNDANGQPSQTAQPTLTQCQNWLVTLPGTPDWAGFLRWMAATYTWQQCNQWAIFYPSFVGFCQFGNAIGAQGVIVDGKVNNGPALTAQQYAQFQQANLTYHLGMILP